MKSLGEQIRYARAELGMTLHGTANTAGISPALLSRIERNLEAPDQMLIKRLAELLHGDLDQWLSSLVPMNKESECNVVQLAKGKPVFFRDSVSQFRR